MTEFSLPQPPSNSAWLALARVLWIVLTIALIGIFIAGLPLRFEALTIICLQEPCDPLSLMPKDAVALEKLGFSTSFYAWFQSATDVLASGALTLIAALIFWRKSHEWIGILVSTTLVLFGLVMVVEADGYLVQAYPALNLPHTFLTILSAVLFVLLLFVFPDGRFVPGWTRWAAAGLAVIAGLDPLLNRSRLTTSSGEFGLVFTIGILIGSLIGMYAQIYRYRFVSNAIERQQTKWAVYGLAMAVLIIFGWSFFYELFPPQPGMQRIIFNLPVYGTMALILTSFPMMIGIAILRYRLWDIDVLIRRTLVYGVLTVLLALLYFGSITLLQNLLVRLSGQRAPISIVLSTLVIASVSSPLRRRVQEWIDRRFYRKKYNAEKTLADFARTVRDDLDLEHLTTVLLQVAEETMQPEHLAIWLRSRSGKDAERQA